MTKLLEVGDKILVEPAFRKKYVATIIRVTKTKACSKYSSFKREVVGENHVNPFSPIDFDTTIRTLITDKK